MTIASPSRVTNDRTGLIREAFQLEYITLGWRRRRQSHPDGIRDRQPDRAGFSRRRLLPLRSGAVNELRELLSAVAAYASGGMKALEDLSARRNAGAIKLLEQMR
jgi:hypothetical protein